MIIGTAQFGQNYGITNLNGNVSEKEIISIFNKARANDINTLDTASSYGDSEKILGKVGVTDFDVMTKLPSFGGISSNFEEFCEKALVASLTQLKLSCVDTVLLHRPEELLGSHGDAIFHALNGLKDKELVRRIGISIYSPDILDDIAEKYRFDVVQVPLNVFDRRIISSGWLKKLADMDISVIARSVFLQGILLSRFDDLPSYFHNWHPQFNAWMAFYKANSLSALEASLQFVAQIPEIDKIIVGIESERQFSEIIKAIKNPITAGSNHLEVSDLGLISPVHWSI